jgi:hypothetical protein
MNNELKNKLQNYIDMHEKYRYAYFWTSFGNASNRRNQEKRFKENYPDFSFQIKNQKIELKPYLSLSCKNVYYHFHIFINEEKKDIRVLRKLIA